MAAAKPGRSFNADVAEGLRRTGKRGAHWITQQTLAGLLSEFLLRRNATESVTQLLQKALLCDTRQTLDTEAKNGTAKPRNERLGGPSRQQLG